MIGDRLKEERERLKLTQPAFAEAAGAKKRTLIDWEKGVSSPTAVQLSALSTVGVDVGYVLTGLRSAVIADAVKATEELALAQAWAATNGAGEKRLTSTDLQAAMLTPEEAALLDNFRNSSPEARAAIKATSYALAQSSKVKNKTG